MFIEPVMLSNHLILCHPLLLLPSICPSIRIFFKESDLHIRWPKYWSFSFSICPSNEYSGLISFRVDWLDLLAVQGTLKSLLQLHSSKASILWRSAFFIISPTLTSTHDYWGKKKIHTWLLLSSSRVVFWWPIFQLVLLHQNSTTRGTSPAVQWLRICLAMQRTPGWGTKIAHAGGQQRPIALEPALHN